MASVFPSITTNWHNDTYGAIDPSRPELSAKGKSIVITGGGAGIGAKVAESFAKAGSTEIGILGRRESALQATKEAVESKFPNTHVYIAIADITDSEAVEKAFSLFASKFSSGKIDYLISNAGYLPAFTSVRDTNLDDWWKGYEVNVKGSFVVTKSFLNHAAAEGAVLINVSTGAAHGGPYPNMSSYTSSKLAGAKFFETVQAENPSLRVINLHPGVIYESEMGTKAQNAGMSLPSDTIELAADFTVWASSAEADFLKGKFLWSNWDVTELQGKKGSLPEMGITTGLNGWGPAIEAA